MFVVKGVIALVAVVLLKYEVFGLFMGKNRPFILRGVENGGKMRYFLGNKQKKCKICVKLLF